MRRALSILLLMLLFPLLGGGEDRACHVANVGVSERWELVTNIFLGIETRAITLEERAAYGAAVPSGCGLLITRVVPGSPAEKSGMRERDLLLYVSGAKLATPADLLVCMRNFRPGVTVHFSRLYDKTRSAQQTGRRRLVNGGKWEMVTVKPEQRPQPIVVGYLIPHKLHADRLAELKPRQAQVARLLTGDAAPHLARVHSEMEAISQMLHSSYTPGNLRLQFSKGRCSITITRYWQCITVTMLENGEETTYDLKHEGDKLPATIRCRLKEMVEE